MCFFFFLQIIFILTIGISQEEILTVLVHKLFAAYKIIQLMNCVGRDVDCLQYTVARGVVSIRACTVCSILDNTMDGLCERRRRVLMRALFAGNKRTQWMSCVGRDVESISTCMHCFQGTRQCTGGAVQEGSQ